ncbi:hypothetical protein Pla100_42520 [Neorhodopirellula pilleata]|uniref:PRTase-CE domain-containing protein n=1 Tax=Neorhodopirellula pilleata TaxID=2714738 RepID=A0A5C6A0J8_9BACT|nr:hypothetical protein Pla100_42520 [Neorhodopirellula pilleata]
MIPEVNELFVLTKCNFFATNQVWPRKTRMNPDGWLKNFDAADRRLACQLLNSFLYYPTDMIDRMFVSAVQGLSRIVTSKTTCLADRRRQWARFLDSAVFTFPTGEQPFAGDSGHLYVRRARNLMSIDEEQIVPPEQAIEQLVNGTAKHVIFVDDFVGTGQQFFKTWHRKYQNDRSFQSVSKTNEFTAYYCPLFCTKFAVEDQLLDVTDRVQIQPTHWLDERQSLFSAESIWWPETMKPEVHDFIFRYSMRIGLPDSGGTQVRDWQGYNQLGLTIGFPDCVPDATIPLFDTTMNGWQPLWRQGA